MYTVAVERAFVAQHFLIGGDWGTENQWHSHHYRLEVRLEGSQLDQHGYLVDIADVERHLDEVVGDYRDRTLNDLPAFAGLNPSIERFASILCDEFDRRLTAPTVSAVSVVIWENAIAWAAYRHERPCASA